MVGKFSKIGSFFLDFNKDESLVIESDMNHFFTLTTGALDCKAVVAKSYAAIEIFLPRAGHYWSGLIGMNFIPDDIKGILVKVKYGETKRRVKSHIIDQNELDIGMDRSFVSAVEKGVKRKADVLSTLGNGVLLVDIAAQNVGSSEYVFEVLASTLCSIVSGTVPSNEVSRLLENEFFSRQ